MRINNNIMALNAHRQLGMNQAGASKSMEKLSSGFRINRAGDDAAGLAISEKMRGQIRGLKQATRNAQDGISLLQTAEGALNETHAILQRMRELAIQASTDTNTLDDRKEIQKEINQLLEEIDRIGDNTEFNTKKLIDGTMASTGTTGSTGEAAAAENVVDVAGVELTINAGVENAELGNIEIVFAEGGTEGVAWSDNTLTVTLDEAKDDYSVADIEALIQGATTDAPEGLDMSVFTVTGTGTIDAVAEDIDSTVTLEGGAEAGAGSAGGKIDSLMVSDSDIDSVNTDAEAAALANAGVLTQAGADAAITNINTAITQVSAERSKLGAYQNRLEHTIANLGTSAENLQAAEARIRDLDIAEEIMAFTKNNILQQAATAMLAQANMAPQSVLQLLG